MSDYAVIADFLILDPVDETSGPTRHRRGDVVDLSGLHANEIKHLKAQGAIAGPKSRDGKDAAANPGDPDPTGLDNPVIETDSASVVSAAVQSGVVLDPSLVPADPAAVVTESGVPARSATVEVWRGYAIAAGVLTEAEAADLTKPQLQEAVARKAAAG